MQLAAATISNVTLVAGGCGAGGSSGGYGAMAYRSSAGDYKWMVGSKVIKLS